MTATNGTAGAPVHATCPALPAGTDYLAFRLMTDPAAQFDGWHVKNIQLNGVDVGTPGDLTGWDNERFFSPLTLDFGFALVGINGTVDAYGDILTSGADVKVFRPTLERRQRLHAQRGPIWPTLSGYAQVCGSRVGHPGQRGEHPLPAVQPAC